MTTLKELRKEWNKRTNVLSTLVSLRAKSKTPEIYTPALEREIELIERLETLIKKEDI